MARGDQLAQPDLVADIVEDLAQTFAVAPVRRGGDAEDPAVGIGAARVVDDPAIAVGDCVVRFVDHQQIKRGHRLEIAGTRQRRHHGEGRLTGPVLAPGIDDRGRDLRRDPAELGAVLRRQLVAMGEDAGLGLAALDGARDDGGERDRLAETGRGDAERVAVIAERSEAALHEEALARTKAHGAAPYCAHAGRPGTGAAAGCGAGCGIGGGLLMTQRRCRAHDLRIVAMIGRDRAADLVLVVAAGIGADIDAGDELDPVEIGKAADPPRRLRLGRHVLVGNPARRVQHAAHQAAAHVGPVRPLGAVEPDQREDLAPGILALGHGELAVEIDSPGGAARGIAAGPALRGIVEPAGADGQAHLGQRALGDEVGVALRVVEIVPGTHGEPPFLIRIAVGIGRHRPDRRAAGRRSGDPSPGLRASGSSPSGGRDGVLRLGPGGRSDPWPESPRG